MTTDVKFFSSSMAGAPQISGTKGSLLAVIDACLVTGFGLKSVTSITVTGGVATVVLSSGNFVANQVILVEGATPAGLNGEKRVIALTGASSFTFEATGVADGTATGTITVKVAPLGWIKEFAGTNAGAYKIDPVLYPDTTAYLVNISDTGNYNARITGYASMSAIDMGTGAVPDASTIPSGLWMFRSDATTTATREWFLVGDGRFVYFGVAHVLNAPFCWSCFGEFKSVKSADPFRFTIFANYPGDSSTAIGAANTCVSCGNNSYAWLAKPYHGLGIPIRPFLTSWAMRHGDSMISGASQTIMSFPNLADYGLYINPVQILEQGLNVYRGVMPGMYFCPQRTGGLITTRTGWVFDTAVVGFEGKTILFVSAGESSSSWGVVAFDLTGPWEH